MAETRTRPARTGQGPEGRGATARRAGGPARGGGAPPRRPGGPRRRPSRGVIWRRRIVALVILLALVVALVWGVSSLVRAATASGAETVAQPSGAPTETQPATTGTCAADAVAGTLSTQSTEVGSPVTFELALENTGEAPCLVDVGRTALTVVVHSGEDRVWGSADCSAGSPPRELLLDVGDSAETALTWTGGRSSVGCEGAGEAVGAGTYRVEALLGGAALEGGEQSFTLG